ncbi:MAG: transcriptional regulator [Planctomycetes bacterium]|nr:transcriptional regulator [Planctomycetota bacterium]
MPHEPAHDKIDEVIHQRVRLGIVSSLAAVESLEFTELKTLLALTDGNLSTHARVLQEAGYLEIEKSFKGRKPQTVFRLSAAGREAFRRYVDNLERMLRGRAQ